MSGDELVAALYTEQGYLLVYSPDELPLGYIAFEDGPVKDRPTATVPLKVVAEVTPEEYYRQQRRACDLFGSGTFNPLFGMRFYKTEACD